MRGIIGCCCAAAFVAMLARPAEAQSESEATALTVGTAVRLRAPTVVSGAVQGKIVEMDASSVVVMNDDRPFRVPRQAITHLEVSTGRHRQWRKGMIIGAAFEGTGLTLLCGGGVGDHAYCAALGLFAGGVWGAGVGALFKTESWSPVAPVGFHVGVAPTPGHGAALSLSFHF
jgi:hypothetical protein